MQFPKWMKSEYVDYSKFAIMPESLYSCTLPYAAEQVINIVEKRFPEGVKSVVDATANIGCDSVNFHIRLGASVVAVEIDKETYECLKKNTKTFGNGDLVAVHDDALNYVSEMKEPVDFVYFDPPWGGADYVKQKTLMLYLGDVALYDVVASVFVSGTKTVIMKVPYNFDYKLFTRKLRATMMERDMVVKFKSTPVVKPGKRKQKRVAFNVIICDV